MNDDPDRLADAWLDGDVMPDQWRAAQAAHGPTLDVALARAQARRAAIADLPRATLPSDLRARLAAVRPQTGPAATRVKPAIPFTFWLGLSTAAMAASLVASAWLLHEEPTPASSAPIARNESPRRAAPAIDRELSGGAKSLAGEPVANSTKDGGAGAPAPAESLLARGDKSKAEVDQTTDGKTARADAQALADAPTVSDAELAQLSKEAQAFAANAPAAPAMPPTQGGIAGQAKPGAGPAAPGPIALALVWEETQQRQQKDEHSDARTRAALAPSSPAPAPKPSVRAAPVGESDAPVQTALLAPARHAAASLTNNTVSDIVLLEGMLKLEGDDAHGVTIWHVAINQQELRIPAAGTTQVAIDLAGALIPPPDVTELHLRLGQGRSAALPLR